MIKTSVSFLSHAALPTDENENIACVETRESLHNGSKIANDTKAKENKSKRKQKQNFTFLVKHVNFIEKLLCN
jgi:hypothetical protein